MRFFRPRSRQPAGGAAGVSEVGCGSDGALRPEQPLGGPAGNAGVADGAHGSRPRRESVASTFSDLLHSFE